MSERMLKAVRHIYPDVSNIVISEDGTVKELSDGYAIPTDEQLSGALDAVDLADTIAALQASIDEHIECIARDRKYSSSLSLATYYNAPHDEYRNEAQVFVAWRDQVWIYAHAELDKVQAGQREQPTIEEFIAELPAIDWPT